MNIGDWVNVNAEMKINQLEQKSDGSIIVSGFIEGDNGQVSFSRIPLSVCKLSRSGVETVLRDTYAK